MSTSTTTKKLYDLAKLHYDRADFHESLPLMAQAAEGFRAERDFSSFLKCQNAILRMHAEREEFEQVSQIKESLQDLVLQEGFELNAKTYYTLALAAAYREQHDVSLEYLQKSLSLALASDNREDICYAINGMAIAYSGMGRFEDALKEIYNLQVFFQVIELPEIRISSQISNARILIEMKKFDQAIDILWQAYESLRELKTISMHLHLLYNMGRAYQKAGEKDHARVYLSLAQKGSDRTNLKRLSRAIDQSVNELGANSNELFDLVFDPENHAVVEKKLGKVDFKNQFILLDLLKLFVQNQGSVYSKEYLVEQVWKQPYDPSVHDNKIYVTIKRLRKMIEPDFEKPKYIFRAKNGYYMNKTAKVYIEQRGDV